MKTEVVARLPSSWMHAYRSKSQVLREREEIELLLEINMSIHLGVYEQCLN